MKTLQQNEVKPILGKKGKIILILRARQKDLENSPNLEPKVVRT